MHKFSEIYIKDFRLLENFSFETNQTKDDLTINILMGKNGSGKSTFIDALYDIAGSQDNPNKIFRFWLTEKNDIILGNIDKNNISIPAVSKKIWHKVIRFYTGHSERNKEYQIENTENCLSFDVNTIKYVLTSVCLSGKWSSDENKDVVDEISRLVFMEKGILVPTEIWIDVKNYNQETFDIKGINFMEDVKVGLAANVTRLRLELDQYRIDRPSFPILNTLINNNTTESNQIINTGFLYKKKEVSGSESLLEENTLSDGELGLIQRMSLILLMKELSSPEQSSLLLLDEPETHFNEIWKRNFIYLVKKILSHTYHDVFIATHSSILATDAKSSELYKFELKNEKIKVIDIPVKLYGSNISDVANILFNIEGDAGRSSTEEIEKLLNSNSKKDIEKIEKLLSEVGPGEYRWRLRAKLQELKQHNKLPLRKVIKKVKNLHKLEHQQ